MKKLAFFDLDGTLCDEGSLQVDPATISAFKELKRNEVLPIIATGRSYYEVRSLLTLLETEHYILSNGCYIRFAGNTIQDAKFSDGQIRKILQIADRHEVAAGYFNQQGFAVSNISEVVKEHVSYMGLTEVPVSPEFYRSQAVNFMNLYLDEVLEEKVSIELAAVADTVRFAPLAIDVLPKNISKGTAMRRLLNFMADPEIETYAFGDQNNDLSMFQLADHGIAMRHSSEQLKDFASYVANTEKGVIEGLKHYGLIL